MAANTSPIFVKEAFPIATNVGVILNATGTDKVDVVTGGTDGSLVQDLSAVSTDTAPCIIKVWISDGVTSYQIGRVSIPASAGDSANPAVSLLNDSDIPSLGKRADGSILLAAGEKLQVSVTVAITAATQVTVIPLGGHL